MKGRRGGQAGKGEEGGGREGEEGGGRRERRRRGESNRRRLPPGLGAHQPAWAGEGRPCPAVPRLGTDRASSYGNGRHPTVTQGHLAAVKCQKELLLESLLLLSPREALLPKSQALRNLAVSSQTHKRGNPPSVPPAEPKSR